MYVSDTHPFIYHAQSKSSRLGKEARRAFLDADAGKALIYIPAIYRPVGNLGEGEGRRIHTA